MFKKIELKNGLRVVILPQPSMAAAALLVMVGAGSKYETDKQAGLSHFLEHIFFKGTVKRPTALEISEALDEVGGEFNAFTSKEFTGFYAKVAKRHLDRAFDVISDILQNSKFDEGELEREKGVIIEEMNMYQDTPMMYVGELFEKLLYPNQPAGRLTVGTKESVLNLKRDDFINYFKSLYLAHNIVVCVAGDVREEEIESKVEKYFDKVLSGQALEKSKVVERQDKANILFFKKETDQTHLCLGVRAYDLEHKDLLALKLLGVILGGSMSSRLFMSVREKLGLAYYIRAHVEAYTDTGYLVAQAGVRNDKLDEAVKTILAEFKKIREEEVPEREFQKAKEFLKGKTLLQLETADEIAVWYAEQEILQNKIETVEDKFAKIDMVTKDDLGRVAKDIFQDNKLNLALIGPKSINNEQLCSIKK